MLDAKVLETSAARNVPSDFKRQIRFARSVG